MADVELIVTEARKHPEFLGSAVFRLGKFVRSDNMALRGFIESRGLDLNCTFVYLTEHRGFKVAMRKINERD